MGRLFLLSVLLAAGAAAQEFRALISGTITDPSGAAIPGAAIVATNTATSAEATAKSAADGNYVIPQLAPGPYRLRVEAAGFRNYVRSGITLSVGDKAALNVRLEVGGTTDSVTVTAELTGIEQNQSVTGQLMDSRKVSELPINGGRSSCCCSSPRGCSSRSSSSEPRASPARAPGMSPATTPCTAAAPPRTPSCWTARRWA